MNSLLVGVGVYVGFQFLVGVIVSYRIRNETDYWLAGRKLGPVLATFSIFATWFGAESIVSASGKIYEHGLSGGSADPFGYALCLLLTGALFARQLWSRGYVTFCDLFRQRYSPGVERLAVLLLVPTSVIWAAAQIRAFGQIVSHSSTVNVNAAITMAAVVVIIYTAAGGLLADAWTDLVQGTALIIGMGVLFATVCVQRPFWEILRSVPPDRLQLFHPNGVAWYEVIDRWAVPVLGSAFAVELISRILACQNAHVAYRASMLGGGIYLMVGLIPASLGLAGPALVPGLDDPEQVMPALAQAHLGTVLFILFAGALISAILSTVDSALLAASALVAHNLIGRFYPTQSERLKLTIARLGVVALGIVAYLLALQSDGIHELIATASAFGSAGVFVVGSIGLFSRFGGPLSAHAALWTGLVVWMLGERLEWPAPYLTSVLASLAAYGMGAVAGVRTPRGL
jgi:Na+/proline symporter